MKRAILFLAALALSGCGEEKVHRVASVFEDLTFRMESGELAGLMGVYPYGELFSEGVALAGYRAEIRDYLSAALVGQDLRLAFVPSSAGKLARGRDGRYYAYVWRKKDGAFVNLETIAAGHGGAMKIEHRHYAEFKDAEERARRERKGFWGRLDELSEERGLVDVLEDEVN